MSTFIVDVLGEILCRLAIDCILRLRCVSKSWLSLIDSPEFAKLHLNHSMKSKSNLCVILREAEYYKEYGKGCFYSVEFGSLKPPFVIPKVLSNPLKSLKFQTKIVGSCNGLLLISNTVDDIALWNPSTRKHKKILPVPGTSANHANVKFGLGYDVVNDDYKVVRIVQFSGSEKGSFRSNVRVYSLKLSCWRVVEEFPYYLRYNDEPGMYLNGSLHWVATTSMGTPNAKDLLPLIVAFDLGTDKCRVVPHPPYSGTGFVVKLAVFEGSLCTFHSYFEDSYDEWSGHLDLVLDHVDIWKLQEYGVRKSWTMIVSLEQELKLVANTLIPVAMWGDEILSEENNGQFFLTNINKGSTEIVAINAPGNLPGFLRFNSYVYLQSLVHLGSTDDKNKLKNQDKGGKGSVKKKRGDDFLSKGFKLKL